MRLSLRFIPGLFTVLNLFSGFLAIIQIMRGQYVSALWLIVIATIFDGMDGKVARFTHNESDFGIEFDSLSDIVSFCLTPSVLIFALYTSDMNFVGTLIAFMPLLFGGIRLARFNIQAHQTPRSYYLGLPVPGFALTIVSYILFNIKMFDHYGDARVILPLSTILSFLMISKVRFPKMPVFSFRYSRTNSIKLTILILAILGTVFFAGYFMFPFILAYITYNIVRWMIGVDRIDEVTEITN